MNAFPLQNNDLDTQMSEQDYLNGRNQELDIRYEYIDGEIWAMAGASRKHNIIAGNFFSIIKQHLKLSHSKCFPFISDWRVKTGTNYYYPDIVVDCNPQENQAGSPSLIIEILSESTRQIDLTYKLHDYQNITTLLEYCIIEQDFMRVAVYRRSDNWKATEYQPNDIIHFESIQADISVKDIYETIIFDKFNQLNNSK